MLLPQEVLVVDDEEIEIDPREELVRRLIEYKKFKEAAEELRISENIESGVYYKPREDFTDYDYDYEDIQFDLKLLLKSLNNIIKRRGIVKDSLDIREIHREEYTLTDCINEIIESLKEKQIINFEEFLGENSSKNEIIAYFLSVLELVKLKKINVIQDKINMEIIITSRDEDCIDG